MGNHNHNHNHHKGVSCQDGDLGFPEFISWKITRGRKTMCKGSGYNSWYATISTNCKLPKGNYKLICYDKKREGFKGGYIKIANKRLCNINKFGWRAGYSQVQPFRLSR